jgi:hypothetical protein
MILSQGFIDSANEDPNRTGCSIICNDDKFDKYVFEAAQKIGEPPYCVAAYPGVKFYEKYGARNCQTWANDVLNLAKKNYIANEDCRTCWKD